MRPAPEILDRWRTRDGTELLIRPVAADDGARELRFIESLSPQTRYERVFAHRGLLPGELRRLVRFDVRQEIALLAAAGAEADPQIVAVARLRRRAEPAAAEFAIVVGDAWQRQGIGARLLAALVDVARRAGIRTISGHTLATNVALKALCRALGFSARADPQDATVAILTLDLAPTVPARPADAG